ncbi:MAG: clostripain-related cysteine peptidase [Elusimicrobiaceae bacterium]
MRLLLSVALLCAPLCAFAADDFNLNRLHAGDIAAQFENSDLEIPVITEPKAAVKPRQPAEWTVMIYMNGKSNVETFAVADMNELEMAGSSAKVNVIAELGRMNGQDGDDTSNGNWSGVRRYYVTKDADLQVINSPVIAQVGEVDMGDWRNVVSFVKWTQANYPAKRYAFILWDHGWGWIDPPKTWKNDREANRSISHDFSKNSYISTTQLAPMFRAIGHVDIFASMACFMQMAEVSYEIKDSADIIIGSEEVIQLASFDFAAIVASLNANPFMTSENAARVFTRTFYNLYTTPENAAGLKESKYAVQLSAIRANRLAGLVRLVNQWTPLAMAANNPNALKAALDGVVRFEVGEFDTDPNKLVSYYGDLYNFVEIFTNSLPDTDMQAKAKGRELMNYMNNELVIENVFFSQDRTGKDYKNTHGLSIHIPGIAGTIIQPVNRYADLRLARESNWDDFIEYLKRYR